METNKIQNAVRRKKTDLKTHGVLNIYVNPE